jgi:hypothetical protein
MSKLSRVLGGVAALIAAGAAAAIYLSGDKKIEKRGPTPSPPVTATISTDVDHVELAIRATFNEWADLLADLGRPAGTSRTYKSKFSYRTQWDRFFLFHKDATGLSTFPSDDQIRLTAGANDSLLRYVAIPAPLRSRDLYLNEPSLEHWWESEYFADGERAKFHCAFLIHLEPAGSTDTRIEIFEYQPTIWAGERLGFSPHALPVPVWLHDIRFVDTTTTDRTEVLRLIEGTLQTHGTN